MNLFQKNIIKLIFFFYCLFALPGPYVYGATAPVQWPPRPIVAAESAILMDAGSGRVLYAKSPFKRRPQASTTKITTTIVALEKGSLTDKVIISDRAAHTGESSIWLQKGEVQTLQDLLYAVMLYSANDAATAVAEHVGGTEANFIRMMNEKAAAIGARDTHYQNPHGLDNPSHYSSAYDLALIARYAMKNPKFQQIVKTPSYSLPWPGHQWPRVVHTRNKLLGVYSGNDGIKTGTTNGAGRCFVGSATRNGFHLISVVLKGQNVWGETQTLLDYGYKYYAPTQVVAKGKTAKVISVSQGEYKSIPLITAGEVILPLASGERERLTITYKYPQTLKAPVERGKKVGEAVISLDGQILAKTDLLAANSIKKKVITRSFWDIFTAVLRTFVLQ